MLSDDDVPLDLVQRFPQLWITQLPLSIRRSAILDFFDAGMSRDAILGVVVGPVDTRRMIGTATIIFRDLADQSQFCQSISVSLSRAAELTCLIGSESMCWSDIPRRIERALHQTVEQARSEMGRHDVVLSQEV